MASVMSISADEDEAGRGGRGEGTKGKGVKHPDRKEGAKEKPPPRETPGGIDGGASGGGGGGGGAEVRTAVVVRFAGFRATAPGPFLTPPRLAYFFSFLTICSKFAGF